MLSTRLTRLAQTAALLVAGLAAPSATLAARPAHAVAENDSATRAALVAERQRVRAELERANAEIDALKRSGRGLREDYRLRERLADAEALARRLTELDARLGGAATPAPRGPAAEPQVSASDGPAELDAKADILADQAQRLAARGDALLGRARDLRARQTLRRRVGQMERDPFSPLEGSKRRAMTGVASASSSLGGNNSGKSSPPTTPSADVGKSGGGTGQTAIATDNSAPSGAGMQPGSTTSPPRTVAGEGTLGPTAAAPSGGANTPGATQTPPTTPATTVAVPSSAGAPAPTSVSDSAALSVQLRDLLDPTTLAEIQRLETTGGAGASTEALERAGAALKTRADRLRQQAAALRASEHAAPRGR
jgi:hypothetical protein